MTIKRKKRDWEDAEAKGQKKHERKVSLVLKEPYTWVLLKSLTLWLILCWSGASHFAVTLQSNTISASDHYLEGWGTGHYITKIHSLFLCLHKCVIAFS